jgi:orotate phosphoribosyltransferase
VTTDMIQSEATRLLEESGALRRGHFILSSGLHSSAYCQCATLFEQPAIGARMAELMATALDDKVHADVVLAPALGAMLWGYELARALGVQSLFAERTGADRTFALRRGFELQRGSRVLLAEDVVTTGGSVMELVPLVRDAGATVAGIASVVDRSGGTFQERAGDEGFPFLALVKLNLPTYDPSELPPELAAIPAHKPGSGGRGSTERRAT